MVRHLLCLKPQKSDPNEAHRNAVARGYTRTKPKQGPESIQKYGERKKLSVGTRDGNRPNPILTPPHTNMQIRDKQKKLRCITWRLSHYPARGSPHLRRTKALTWTKPKTGLACIYLLHGVQHRS